MDETKKVVAGEGGNREKRKRSNQSNQLPAFQPPEHEGKKQKKPKHLARKLAQAEAKQDAEMIHEITQQQQELETKKRENAKKWKELCKTLVGEEKWDEAQFDQLVARGMDKKKIMLALGITEVDENGLAKKVKKTKKFQSSGQKESRRSGEGGKAKKKFKQSATKRSGASKGEDPSHPAVR